MSNSLTSWESASPGSSVLEPQVLKTEAAISSSSRASPRNQPQSLHYVHSLLTELQWKLRGYFDSECATHWGGKQPYEHSRSMNHIKDNPFRWFVVGLFSNGTLPRCQSIPDLPEYLKHKVLINNGLTKTFTKSKFFVEVVEIFKREDQLSTFKDKSYSLKNLDLNWFSEYLFRPLQERP